MVYKALDQRDGMFVALKIMHDMDDLASFEKEIHIMEVRFEAERSAALRNWRHCILWLTFVVPVPCICLYASRVVLLLFWLGPAIALHCGLQRRLPQQRPQTGH